MKLKRTPADILFCVLLLTSYSIPDIKHVTSLKEGEQLSSPQGLLSPWGQIQLVKRDLMNLSRGKDQETLRVIAMGLASVGNPRCSVTRRTWDVR
jgi:hypothetical protein